ncbi:phage portal protein [Priestia megaterium]|uniref:phage portal protein n=1 Tax=Priestia megaterium TaxID=1404 RepID=UPI0021C0CDAE|nr:phage portal protein [Priestia megaterium]MCT9858219.1 phage portal protein [Priestia megaterium]MDF1958485.1 phage portal protein [Priestia megaterium]
MANPFTWGKRKTSNERDYFSAAIYSSRPASIITEEQAMQIPAVKAAVDLISNSISTLPVYLHVENEIDQSIEKVKDSRVNVLNHDSNKFDTAQAIKRKIVVDYLLHGVAYLYRKDGNLHHLPAKNVQEVPYTEDDITPSKKEFIYNGMSTVTLEESEVIVIDSATYGALVGGGKIFVQASHQIDYSTSLLSNSAVPSGLLKSASRLTDKAIKNLRESWDSLYQGLSKVGKTIILEEGMDFQPLSMKPDEMGLKESNKHIVSEIARVFNIPESLINSQANKYNSLEANNISFLQNTLTPIITAIESAFDKQLLTDTEKQLGYFFRFDTSEIIRTTEKEKIETVSAALNKSLISFNEARTKLDMKPASTDYYVLSIGNALMNIETGSLTIPNMGVVDNKQVVNATNENGIEKQQNNSNE